MTPEILFVFVVVAVAGGLFVSGKLRLDIVALLVVLSFSLRGILTPSEAFAGFGNPVVIMVAGLLVISDMLARTGIAHQVGEWLVKSSRNGEARLLALLMVVVAILGCFMSNIAVNAIFIPVVLSIANTSNLNSSRLLMPLVYAGVVGGMTSLIASTSNIVVSAELTRAGFEPFGFFSFTPIGISVLVVVTVFMITVGRRLLPGERVNPPKTPTRTVRDLLEEFEIPGAAYRLKVPAKSSLVGHSLTSSTIGEDYSIRVIMIERRGPLGSALTTVPPADTEIRAGDVLVAVGDVATVGELQTKFDLQRLEIHDADLTRWAKETGIAKVLIHSESRLIGSTLRKFDLRSIYHIQILGLKRKEKALPNFVDQKIKSADSMLVVGQWSRIRKLQSKLNDFVVLALPAEIELVAPTWQRAPVALGILAFMVTLSVFKLTPIVVAVTISSLLAVATRCLTMEQAYNAIHWSTIVLIAGMMSISKAFVKTGALDLIVENLVGGIGELGPHVLLAVLFVVASGSGVLLSGITTSILLAPIAVRAAETLEVTPYAFAITIAIGASSGFVLPVANPAAVLVVSQGEHRLSDYFKVGVPLLVLTGAVTIFLAPRLFPF